MKLFKWLNDKLLFVLTLFLISFIPLYPKLPLLDIKNTWVYIRIEDFIVFLALAILGFYVIKKKVSLRSPLTMPILIFWVLGALSTIHGILLIFPTMANVFPNVAFLSYVRRIEYLAVFFLAYASIVDKKWIKYIVMVIAATLFFVCIYGIGQRYLGFPAYLTMNEEFAKGEPIRLSPFSRVPSTFAGHYDLAAYLVLVIPIIASVIFGVKNWGVRILLGILSLIGFIVMFMTVSRVSFFVLILSLGIVLFVHKRKLVLAAVPLCLILVIPLANYAPSLVNRLGSTIQEVDVLVDASTGRPIGHAKEVPYEYFKDKVIVHDYALTENTNINDPDEISEKDASNKDSESSDSENISTEFVETGIVPYYNLPEKVTVLVPLNKSTGENLPEGTGYINLSLSPVEKKLGEYFLEQNIEYSSLGSPEVIIKHGNYLVKRAAAYDLSFTTRFQGEWPHAISAFMRNVFVGSGYGSISLAIDNNYFRLLGEIGVLGTVGFISIFLAAVLYIKKVFYDIDSLLVRSFVIGFLSGVVGLFLNAIFIDVFEASKVAFVLWLLMGLTIGIVSLYSKRTISLSKELKDSVISTPAVVIYLLVTVLVIFSPMLNNYFVGDDFTWFRWAAEGDNIINYFTKANGFFYRPGTKLYFYLMYNIFWLNQAVYHAASVFFHFLVAALVFLIGKRLTVDRKLPILASFLFLFISGHHEAVFWIASTGHLIASFFMLCSILLFMEWEKGKRGIMYVFSFIFLSAALLFHEFVVMTPFVFILYQVFYEKPVWRLKGFEKILNLLLFLPLIVYGVFRYLGGSHWFSGDYNYNILKLPLNFIGNLFGYSSLGLAGPFSLSFYSYARMFMRNEILISVFMLVIILISVYLIYRVFWIKIKVIIDKKLIGFSIGFFVITLLPFLGLGNIASRYSYFPSIGIAFILAFLFIKFYNFLLPQGKNIAVMTMSVVLALFVLFHLIQLQEIHGDWKTAGMKAERFIIALDEIYQDYWSVEPMTINFFNIPLRSGQAWIFPVGIEDALWLNFRNPSLTVNNISSIPEVLDSISNPRNEKIYEIDESGKLIEHKKKLLTQ